MIKIVFNIKYYNYIVVSVIIYVTIDTTVFVSITLNVHIVFFSFLGSPNNIF